MIAILICTNAFFIWLAVYFIRTSGRLEETLQRSREAALESFDFSDRQFNMIKRERDSFHREVLSLKDSVSEKQNENYLLTQSLEGAQIALEVGLEQLETVRVNRDEGWDRVASLEKELRAVEVDLENAQDKLYTSEREASDAWMMAAARGAELKLLKTQTGKTRKIVAKRKPAKKPTKSKKASK